jgi:YHS domain-containing protein
MAVTNKSFHHSEHKGHCFYFCGAKCKARFVADPARYSGELEAFSSAPAQPESPPGFQWHWRWLLALAALLALVIGGLWRM